MSFGFGTRAPSGLLILSLPLRQAKSTPHQNLDSTYTNEIFYENTKIKKSSFLQKIENFEKSNEKRNAQRNNEERILEEHALEPKKVIFICCLQSFFQKCERKFEKNYFGKYCGHSTELPILSDTF